MLAEPHDIQLLIDADILYHRAAFSVEDIFEFGGDPVRTVSDDEVVTLFNGLIIGILIDLNPKSYILCWSSNTNFRKKIYADYKANRKHVRRPVATAGVKNHLMLQYPSIVVQHLEADDLMGLLSHDGTVIVSDDKDLLTVPGLHYKPRAASRGIFPVSLAEADRLLLKQTLMGDAVDGYKGIPGIGDKKSDKILYEGGCTWQCVLDAYEKAGLSSKEALMNARLARILRPGEWDYILQEPHLWTP